MREKPLESDWRTFRDRIPEWRERYLRRKNEEILVLLTDAARTPTERFWAAKARMDQEARVLEACLDGHSRSKMRWYLSLMHRHGVVEDADLNAFSDELRAWVVAACEA